MPVEVFDAYRMNKEGVSMSTDSVHQLGHSIITW